MKKLIKLISSLEIILSSLTVAVLTFFTYGYLSRFPSFWNAQSVWSVALMVCWTIVAIGYFHQGWLVRVHNQDHAHDVSIILPIAVFIVQCILFVKGIFYGDWSLVLGAVVVNSGVIFSLMNILRARRSTA